MKRKPAPWYSLVAGAVGCLTVVGVLFGNVMAFGKQQAKTEQVEKDVDALKEEVEEQDQELKTAQTEQRLIQQDLGYLKEGMKQLLERKR